MLPLNWAIGYVHVEEQRWREPGEREFILSRRKRNDSAYTHDRSL